MNFLDAAYEILKQSKAPLHYTDVTRRALAAGVHEQGIIITTSDFSSGALREAQEAGKARISLINGEQLLDLLIKHRIGVTAEQHTIYALDAEWWGDITAQPDPPPFLPAVVLPPVIYPLLIQATHHDRVIQAELLDATGRVSYDGTEYQSPSGAGQAASGWKSCNGWTFWRYQQLETGDWRVINELRAPHP